MWRKLIAALRGERERRPESGAILSLLAPDDWRGGALPAHAICGGFRGEGRAPEDFEPNPAFAALLHRVVRETAPTLREFQEAARAQGQGSLSVIDLRTPEGVHGNVPLEDIVGIFAVADGVATPASYHPIEEYRVFTRNGLTRLPSQLHAALLEAMRRP